MRPKTWRLSNGAVTANALQKITWKVWDADTSRMGEERPERIVAVSLGDVVEGMHHNNKQIVTPYVGEQEDIAYDAISHGLKNMSFGGNDEFFIVSGTPSHVDESENRLGKLLNATPYQSPLNLGGNEPHPALKLNINGVRFWFMHKLAAAGNEGTAGNSLRNKARDIYTRAVMDGIEPPDYVFGAHFHTRRYSPWGHDNKDVKAFIIPSYKAKDHYTLTGFEAFGLSDIGLIYVDIDDDGRNSWDWTQPKVKIQQVKEIKL